MKRINLLPISEQRELELELASRQIFNFWLWVVGSMLVLFLLFVGTIFHLNIEIAETETEIAKNKETLNTAANQQLEKQVVELNTEIMKINLLRSQHYRWSEGLIELGSIIPSDMVVDLLVLDRASGKVEIAGEARDRASIIQFWSDMHKSRYFRNIDFPLSNLESARNASFSFVFYINEERISQ